MCRSSPVFVVVLVVVVVVLVVADDGTATIKTIADVVAVMIAAMAATTKFVDNVVVVVVLVMVTAQKSTDVGLDLTRMMVVVDAVVEPMDMDQKMVKTDVVVLWASHSPRLVVQTQLTLCPLFVVVAAAFEITAASYPYLSRFLYLYPSWLGFEPHPSPPPVLHPPTPPLQWSPTVDHSPPPSTLSLSLPIVSRTSSCCPSPCALPVADPPPL